MTSQENQQQLDESRRRDDEVELSDIAREEDFADILELIDPDWTDHFLSPEQGLWFYDASDVVDAVKEFYGETPA